MSEMIERVARALYVVMGGDPESADETAYRTPGGLHVSWPGPEDEPVPRWRFREDAARAAIETLREPSDVMIDLGVLAAHSPPTVDTTQELVGRIYRAMIDAALSPSKEG